MVEPLPCPQNVLIATIGSSPEVVTEVLDKIETRGIEIHRVVAVHTNDDIVQHGKYRAIIEDEDQLMSIKSDLRTEKWNISFKHQKGLDDLKIELDNKNILFSPESCGPADITCQQDNVAFAKLLFEVIIRENRKGHNVYISLAGGRKTMSAYALLGAILFGAKEVFHVLISESIETDLLLHDAFHVNDIRPPRLREGEFYELVTVPIPELRSFLSEALLSTENIPESVQAMKFSIDVVKRLAQEEKTVGDGYRIFDDLEDKVEDWLDHEIVTALDSAQDPVPGPWHCLQVTNPEDAPLECKEQDEIQLFAETSWDLDQAETQIDRGQRLDPDTDLVVLNIDPAGDSKIRFVRLLRRMHRDYPLLPIVCLTQGRDTETARHMTQAGATLCMHRAEAYRLYFPGQALFTQSLPPDPQIEIRCRGQVAMPKDQAQLIRILFPETQAIDVWPPPTTLGFSNTTKWWAKPKGHVMPHFVKFGSPLELAQEKAHYEHLVRGALDNFAGRIERDVVVFTDDDNAPPMAAIAYTAVGLPGAHTPDSEAKLTGLGAYIRDARTQKQMDQPRQLIRDLFKRILTGWYGDSHEQPLVPQQHYGRVLPAWLTLQWSGLIPPDTTSEIDLHEVPGRGQLPAVGDRITVRGELYELSPDTKNPDTGKMQLTHPDFGYKVAIQDVADGVFVSRKLHLGRRVGVVGRVVSRMGDILRSALTPAHAHLLDEPLAALHTLFEQLQSDPKPVKMATIHGDLNLDNVQTDGERLWLIDFAFTRYGPIAFDFAKAEVELKVCLFDELMQGLDDPDDVQSYLDFEDQLAAPAQAGSAASDPSLAALIHTIRDAAAPYCQQPAWDYDLALLVYNLTSLKFDHAQRSAKSTALLLIAGATLAARRATTHLNEGACQ